MSSEPPDKTDLSPEAAAAMTVNERLHAAGLLADFDAAVAARDEAALRALLSAVHLSEPDIAAIVRRVMGRPRRA